MARNINLQILASGAIDLKTVSERDFSVAIREYAEGKGWKVEYRFRSAVKTVGGNYRGTGPAGFPDLVMVRDGQAIAAELKSERGSATPEQRQWLEALEAVPGVEAFLWRPRDSAAILERMK